MLLDGKVWMGPDQMGPPLGDQELSSMDTLRTRFSLAYPFGSLDHTRRCYSIVPTYSRLRKKGGK